MTFLVKAYIWIIGHILCVGGFCIRVLWVLKYKLVRENCINKKGKDQRRGSGKIVNTLSGTVMDSVYHSFFKSFASISKIGFCLNWNLKNIKKGGGGLGDTYRYFAIFFEKRRKTFITIFASFHFSLSASQKVSKFYFHKQYCRTGFSL